MKLEGKDRYTFSKKLKTEEFLVDNSGMINRSL